MKTSDMIKAKKKMAQIVKLHADKCPDLIDQYIIIEEALEKRLAALERINGQID